MEQREDEGFSLIELLVVVIIIGMLAAIAIPIYLRQKDSAVETGMRSDLHTMAVLMETYDTDYATYPTSSNDLVTAYGTDYRVSPQDQVSVDITHTSATAFCLRATDPRDQKALYWQSDGGGLLPKGKTCS